MSFKRWAISAVVIAAVVTIIALTKQQMMSGQSAMDAGGEPVMTVEALVVEQTEYAPTIEVTGEINALQQMQLTTELAGTIRRLNLPMGGVVASGQVLVELEHAEESAKLIGANAKLELYQTRLKRLLSLQAKKQISEEQVDEVKADVKLAESEVAQLKATINKKIFKAPFAARVGIHDLELGQYLDSNTVITTLVGLNDSVWVDFQLPQSYLPLAIGDQVQVSLIGKNDSHSAQIVAVSPQLTNARSFDYRAKLTLSEAAIAQLYPNTLVSIQVPVAAAQSVIKVPELALARDQFGAYVYVLDSDQGDLRAKRTAVRVLATDNGWAVLQGDLHPAQQIATKGSFKLFPSAKVNIVSAESEAQ
ncbi:efflux RND transporter periplasmic adaptor subunit [Neiella sp. HB171785]|uniref:Efflux RND transporter periplasmic adaptor subunit n=1 Tax=Neiella litorisoli TaxID=2771431 RepID=A0A8J6QF40_9GAMM|nr:efflux RND transporter periplasmic adaptor subunit [Neiella litorisoli]MBD1388494.1 efflux RND transporter periplasmic adaptor subunit [Neiella litorisoli]